VTTSILLIDISGRVDALVFMLIAVVAAIVLIVALVFGEAFGIADDFGVDVGDAGGGVLNLQTAAAFLAGFGAVAWLLAAYFDVPSLLAALGGLAGGVPMAAAIVGMTRFFMRQSVSSGFALNDLVGSDAIVVLAIPEVGVGRIQFERAGGSHTVTARSSSGPIARGAIVRIRSVVAGECIVAPLESVAPTS
jgi:hypothetical protein